MGLDLTTARFLLDVSMPFDATIVAAQIQPGQGLCLWALVHVECERAKRKIEIYSTGHIVPNPSTLRHIATVQDHGGALVWHVFERE